MYNELIDQIKTKREVQEMEYEIEILSEAAYSTEKGVFEHAMENRVRSWVASGIKAGAKKAGVSIAEYLKGLEKALDSLNSMRLSLAFEPSNKQLTSIHAWVTSNIGKGIILETKYNPRLAAGAIINYNGEYRDFSVRGKIEDKLAALVKKQRKPRVSPPERGKRTVATVAPLDVKPVSQTV